MTRGHLCVAAVLVASGCNSLVGFDLEGGEDGGGGETKTLVVRRTGDMRGIVTSTPSGINCSPTIDRCSSDFPRGSMVMLTATGAAGSYFAGWSGGDCSGTGTCTVTLGIDTSIDARFEDISGGHNFAFVTKSDHPPTTLNLPNADAICEAEAAAAGLPAGGIYKAWLSTSTVDAKDRLGNARGWVRVDGRPVADTIADLTSGKLLHPIRLKADGGLAQNDGANHAVILTGTMVNGTHATTTCADWTSSSAMVRVGNANGTGYPWTDWFDGADCAGVAGFYCFGTSRSMALTVTPTPGRLAFVSSMTWMPGGGIASADAFCQTEATMAGRAGTFKAALATSTASAASRFDTSGAPWVRPDGIPIAKPGVSPFDEIVAPINVRLDGTYVPGAWAATGATAPTATATLRGCDDWTSTGGVYIVGSVEDSLNWFTEFGPQTVSCSNPSPIYCFEQ